ncbi:MAG: YajG family lipoprotein [Limisphaerales bacterium]
MIANFLKSAPFLLSILLLGSGCALTKENIGLHYTPNTHATKVPGAENAHITVTATDSRAIKDRVSSKKNGYGMEMAPIIATNDVATLFREALEVELEQLGFQKGAGANLVCDITRFYNDFKVGFWAGDAAADAMVNIQVKDNKGPIIFTKSYASEGRKENIQLAGGNNARVALEAALNEIVRKAIADPDLIAALLKGGSATTVSQR